MQITPLLFEVHPSSGVPIYRQIMDQVRAQIAGGKLATGDVLPSVRQMAAELGINMMTVSKAYSKLEADGILSRSRGQGMVVDEQNCVGSVSDRRKELQPFAEQLVVRGIQLDLTIVQLVAGRLDGGRFPFNFRGNGADLLEDLPHFLGRQFFFVFLVKLGLSGIGIEFLDLLVDQRDRVLEPRQIRFDFLHLAEGFFSLNPVFRYTRRLFEHRTSFLRLRTKDKIHAALVDDGIAVAADAGV